MKPKTNNAKAMQNMRITIQIDIGRPLVPVQARKQLNMTM